MEEVLNKKDQEIKELKEVQKAINNKVRKLIPELFEASFSN